MEKIGFFGGCFNPVTKAHVELIREVIEKENLDKVYFVPMGDFYEKQDLISFEHRKAMLGLALQNEDKMEILEISNQKEKTYAIDTFQKIDCQFPEVQRFFIMGTDNYEKMRTWKNQELLQKYHYILLDRNKESMSSTMVRNKIKQGEDFVELVPEAIVAYIKENNLYK